MKNNKESFREHIGDIIYNWLEDCDLTNEELAEKLDVSVQAICSWKNGTKNPDLHHFVELAVLLSTRSAKEVDLNEVKDFFREER